MKKIFLIFATLLVFTFNSSVFTQVSINTDGASPNGSSMLEVKSSDKGMLIPQVALTGSTDASTISSAANSLLIYNTATTSDVTPGYYYWDNTQGVWFRLITSNDSTLVQNMSVSLDTLAAVVNIGPYKLQVTMCDLLPDGGSGHPGGIGSGEYCKTDTTRWADGAITRPADAEHFLDGQANTTSIVAHFGAGDYPAYYCDTLTYLGYTDWYLPSIRELIAIAIESKTFFPYTGIPGDAPSYWSSTQSVYEDDEAYGLSSVRINDYSGGFTPEPYGGLLNAFATTQQFPKTTFANFRCVRKF